MNTSAAAAASGHPSPSKWEPTDNVDFKWRTEYTDDETDPPAQLGLNEFNKWVDLGDAGNLDSFAGSEHRAVEPGPEFLQLLYRQRQ